MGVPQMNGPFCHSCFQCFVCLDFTPHDLPGCLVVSQKLDLLVSCWEGFHEWEAQPVFCPPLASVSCFMCTCVNGSNALGTQMQPRQPQWGPPVSSGQRITAENLFNNVANMQGNCPILTSNNNQQRRQQLLNYPPQKTWRALESVY